MWEFEGTLIWVDERRREGGLWWVAALVWFVLDVVGHILFHGRSRLWDLNHLLLFLILDVCVSFDALTNGGHRLRSLLKQIQSLSLVFWTSVNSIRDCTYNWQRGSTWACPTTFLWCQSSPPSEPRLWQTFAIRLRDSVYSPRNWSAQCLRRSRSNYDLEEGHQLWGQACTSWIHRLTRL